MEELLRILNDLDDSIDYITETNLIEEELIDSLYIVRLITEIESEFDVEIPVSEMIPNNFNSYSDIWKLIERSKK